MPRYTSTARQLEYENLLLLRRLKSISGEAYRHEKAKIDRREAKAEALADAKRQVKAAAAARRREDKKRLTAAANALKKQRASVTKRVFKMIDTNIRNGTTTHIPLREIDTSVGLAEIIKKLNSYNNKLTLKIGETYYVLSDTTRVRLLQAIQNEVVVVDEYYKESDVEFILSYKYLTGDLEIAEFVETNQNVNNGGGFFPYTHNTHFDLKRYGLYKTGEPQDHSDCCLVNALKLTDLPLNDVERVKMIVKNRIIPQCKLKEVCDILKVCIRLKRDDANNTTIVYGKQYEKIIHIGLLAEHYFLIEPTEITNYCLKNYQQVKNLPRCNEIYKLAGKYYERSTSRFADSFDIIKTLLQNKDTLLKESSMEDRLLAATQFYDSIKQEIGDLHYDENECCKPVEVKNKAEKVEYQNIVFDFETDPNGVHKPYLCRIWGDGINRAFIGADCGLQMLRSLKTHTRLIAHNATYDYRFLMEHLWNISEMARGNRLISLDARFGSSTKNIKIKVKDTYHLISMPLRAFPKVFGLSSQKEVMPYTLYTQENIAKRFVPIADVLPMIDDEDKQQFLNNIEKWDLKKDDTYDIIEYSSRYCELDCKILWEGYNIFRKWMMDCVSIDIDDVLTIASLAHRYFIIQGCYEGVNQVGGVPQLFIQGAVVGGRTMCANNEKIVLNEKVNDFDAVSLYPSAMARLPGFLKGVPKVVENLSYDWLQQQDGYFVDVVIKSVGVTRAFPLMSSKNDEGIRMFTNDMVGKTIRVDKITLEDLITFHDITFDVVRGYYFDEGFNTKVCDTIKYLFNERLTKKKEKNPAEMIYKLIMNSSYGKSIMKPVDEETKFFDREEDFNVYLSRQYNWVKTYVKFGTKYKVKKVKTLLEHFNIAHVGVSILSMSKRIMNEVMCLAEDVGLDLYYQDTDSIHIKDCDIKTLADAFNVKHGRELIGKGMGQFHSDFDMKGCSNIYARRSIFLGKKSYIDELVGTDADGKEHIDYHIRMKGIPNSCLLYTASKLNYANVFDMYADLYAGKSIEVDLTNGGDKANFKFNPDYSCNTLSLFKRTMAF